MHPLRPLLLALLLPCAARATLILEDFSGVTDNASLLGTSGGGGFSGNWGASTGVGANTSRIKFDIDLNLAYAGGGYAVNQSGTGRAYADFNAFRGINRPLSADPAGTTWFSLLVQTVNATAHAGIQFNNHADLPFTGLDYNRGLFDVGIRVNQLEVRYGGADSTGLLTLAQGQPHLLLGRIVFQDNGVNDRLDVWADPADLGALGAPLFSANGADIGANLFLAGVFGYGSGDIAGTQNAFVDALRISDGNGDPGIAFLEVTGVVPEPGSLGLVLLGLPLLLRRRRR